MYIYFTFFEKCAVHVEHVCVNLLVLGNILYKIKLFKIIKNAGSFCILITQLLVLPKNVLIHGLDLLI